MFMHDDYYQIMDKAFLNINPTTGIPTVTATNPMQRDILKSTNNASPSNTNVYFRSEIPTDPDIRDDQNKVVYLEDGINRSGYPAGAYAVWVEKVVPKEVKICFRGKTFRKVKWIPGNNSAWFSGNDNLKGTHTVGIEGDDEREWAIDFSSMTFDNFLFASGDFFNWIWTSDAFLNKDASGTPQMYGTSDGYKSFDVLQSSLNAQAHQLSYFKFNNAAHPYVRTTGDDADALYLDNSVKYAP